MKIEIGPAINYNGVDSELLQPGTIHEIIKIDQSRLGGIFGFVVRPREEEITILPNECRIVEMKGEEE